MTVFEISRDGAWMFANRIKYFFVALIFIFPLFAQARMFETLDIPGAHCGRGGQYFILVNLKNLKKFAFVFEGGGACWDFVTCSTSIATRLTHSSNMILDDAIYSEDPGVSPLADYSMVFFPYCTGDLFAGNFSINYQGIFKVDHHGRRNVLLGLQHLLGIYGGVIRAAREAVFYGFSAGALGLMMNFTDLHEKIGRFLAKKTVLLDGMGLHWDASVWHRFSPEMLRAISQGFSRMDVSFSPEDWPLAKRSLEVCQKFPDYQFGLLQGSMDWIMGSVFGFMSPLEHRARVYGPEGIYQTLLEPNDNCAAFVPDTFKHTFLEKDGRMGLLTKTRSGVTAYQFVQDLIRFGAKASYR